MNKALFRWGEILEEEENFQRYLKLKKGLRNAGKSREGKVVTERREHSPTRGIVNRQNEENAENQKTAEKGKKKKHATTQQRRKPRL